MISFNQLYDIVTHLPLTSTDLPIKVNGEDVVDIEIDENYNINLITEERNE